MQSEITNHFSFRKEPEIVMDAIPLLLVIILCVLASAYFSASETAFSTMNRLRVKTLADDGNRRAQAALKLVENYDRLITTILIGNKHRQYPVRLLGHRGVYHVAGRRRG